MGAMHLVLDANQLSGAIPDGVASWTQKSFREPCPLHLKQEIPLGTTRHFILKPVPWAENPGKHTILFKITTRMKFYYFRII